MEFKKAKTKQNQQFKEIWPKAKGQKQSKCQKDRYGDLLNKVDQICSHPFDYFCSQTH
jgi:hypothetical protein